MCVNFASSLTIHFTNYDEEKHSAEETGFTNNVEAKAALDNIKLYSYIAMTSKPQVQSQSLFQINEMKQIIYKSNH